MRRSIRWNRYRSTGTKFFSPNVATASSSKTWKTSSPTPSFSASLAYFDSCRTARLPQNLTQAQRDAFGAHTYERTDKPRGKFFHVDWPDPARPQLAV